MSVNGTLIQPLLLGADFLRSSCIPFLGGDPPERAYQTTFQKDFVSFASHPKTNAVPRPPPAQVEHKDLQRIKEYETEVSKSYSQHPLTRHKRTPAWTKLCTNLKMHSDLRQVNFNTTQATDFKCLSSPLPGTKLTRPGTTIKNNPKGASFPETTHKSSYVSCGVKPISKAEVKHLGGVPTIPGDKARSFFSTSYNETFQDNWCPPPQSVEKHFRSSVAMGDPEKVLETRTTHSASFSRPGPHSPVTIKKRLKLNLGDIQENEWTTTSADAHKAIKTEPVCLVKRIRTSSSVPRGDTDPVRNRQIMSSTTNRFFFPEGVQVQVPKRVHGMSIRNKSNVEFGTAGMSHNTVFQEDFTPKDGIPAQPRIYPPGKVLGARDLGPSLSTVRRDYLPPNSKRQELSPRQLQQIKESHIRTFDQQRRFNTTHKDAFGPKPLSKSSLDNPPLQHISHMPF